MWTYLLGSHHLAHYIHLPYKMPCWIKTKKLRQKLSLVAGEEDHSFPWWHRWSSTWPQERGMVHFQKIIWLVMLYVLEDSGDNFLLPCEKLRRPCVQWQGSNQEGFLFSAGYIGAWKPLVLLKAYEWAAKTYFQRVCWSSFLPSLLEALILPVFMPFPFSSPCHPPKAAHIHRKCPADPTPLFS